jgi:uncharacterized protein (TIGR02246 family)
VTGEDAVRAALATQVEAWNRGDVDGFCAVCSDDTTYLGAGGLTVGRQAVAARYRERYPDRSAMGQLALEVVSLAPTADQVTVIARWSLAGEPARGGWALLVFARTPAGWRLTHDATL